MSLTPLEAALRRKYRTPAAALHALGIDQIPETKSSSRTGVDLLYDLKQLKARMSPEGFAAFLKCLDDDAAKDNSFLDRELQPLDQQRDRDAMDEPPDFTGKPKTGGGKATGYAADSAAMSSFTKMHPDAARIGVGGVANSHKAHQKVTPSADATRRFAEMFPGAGDIKI